VLERALRRNPDGTLVGVQRRQLVIVTDDDQHPLPFPRAWGEAQLRAAAEARGLLTGRPVSAHVPPPETLDEFKESSRSVIKAVFGQFALDAYTSSEGGEMADVKTVLVRFNLSHDYFRAVAGIASICGWPTGRVTSPPRRPMACAPPNAAGNAACAQPLAAAR
jgi:hypothetical protein